MELSRRSFLKAGGTLAAAGLCGALDADAAGAPPMQTSAGAARPTAYGTVTGRGLGGGVNVWYGVPYAAPPSGGLRWQSPQPPAPWQTPLDCTAPAPMALQPCGGAAAGSEDCLRLDIYAPANAAGLPVAVYFHGGSNRTGTTLEMNGARLAQKAGCVVVSVGYRLGLLGFNSLPALCAGPDATGNFALLDAARAFDWVEENIAAFGGDPRNVTALGFSAGGRDVLAMLASPLFAGRFHKAAALSAGLTMTDPAAAARQTARAFAPLAVEDGLFAAESDALPWLLTDGGDVRRWLYDLDPARLCALMPEGGDLRLNHFPQLFADGVTLPAGGFAQAASSGVPLLLVTGATEFSLFNPMPDWYQGQSLSPADAAAARQTACGYGSALYRVFNGAAAAAALAPRTGAPVWLCELDCGAPGSRSPITALGLGSYHGISLPLLTGENSLAAVAPLDGAGWRAVSDALTGALAAFLRSGDPGGSPLPVWQPWTAGAPQAMALDADGDGLAAAVRPAPADCGPILDALAADPCPPAAKDLVIRRVLNGRIFSAPLDARFGNESLWV